MRGGNGPQYASGPLMEGAGRKSIALTRSQSGKPRQNAYGERYNPTVRMDG